MWTTRNLAKFHLMFLPNLIDLTGCRVVCVKSLTLMDRINISEESTFLLVDPWGSCTKEPLTLSTSVDTVMQCLQVSQFSQLSRYFPNKHLGYYIIPVLHDNCMIITWYFTTSFSPLTSILEKRGKVSGHLSCAKAWHPAAQHRLPQTERCFLLQFLSATFFFPNSWHFLILFDS